MIASVEHALPEFPRKRRDRFVEKYRLPKYDADVLTTEKLLADYFENVVAALRLKNDETYKLVSNWTMGEVLRVANERANGLQNFPVPPTHLADMIDLLVDGTISSTIAKEVFEEMRTSGDTATAIVHRKGLVQVSDAAAIENVVDEVLARSQEQVATYRAGKQQVFGYFVGETMKAMKGKANPKIVNEVLRRKLDSMSR
jgi:aspartyl-tRNA(Asn)/glutamyl-tRNA(Gln) amidotransferase subunit B